MLVGEHEWAGRLERYTPDPYGRWILGANLLPLLEDSAYGSAQEREIAARALHRLAHTAGRNGALARTPVYDDLVAALRQTMPLGALGGWDLLAPSSRNLVPSLPAGRALASALAEAGLRRYPAFEPIDRMRNLRLPVVLLHGRMDTLVPFTETLRLAAGGGAAPSSAVRRGHHPTAGPRQAAGGAPALARARRASRRGAPLRPCDRSSAVHPRRVSALLLGGELAYIRMLTQSEAANDTVVCMPGTSRRPDRFGSTTVSSTPVGKLTW
jgi:hypothetical protein